MIIKITVPWEKKTFKLSPRALFLPGEHPIGSPGVLAVRENLYRARGPSLGRCLDQLVGAKSAGQKQKRQFQSVCESSGLPTPTSSSTVSSTWAEQLLASVPASTMLSTGSSRLATPLPPPGLTATRRLGSTATPTPVVGVLPSPRRA